MSSKNPREDDDPQDEAPARKARPDPSREAKRAAKNRSEPKRTRHEKELDAAPTRDTARREPDEERERTIRHHEPRAPRSGLDRIVTRSAEDVAPEEPSEGGGERADEKPLEERVSRSVRSEDLATMRSLAEKMYYEGWPRLSVDEQLAFLYHTRFLEYVSEQERSRPEVRQTIYRFLGAQGKSLGVSEQYRTGHLSSLSERFFERVLTPINAPELYRRVANTDYFIGNASK